MDTQAKLPTNKRVLFSLSCVAILAISTLACDPDAVDEVSDVDEQAALDAENTDALELAPNPGVWIESVETIGVGCPDPESAQVGFASDTMRFFISFNDMLLTNPDDAPVQITNCVVSATLHIPDGWQVSVKNLNAYGVAFLDEGLDARNMTNYFFAGNPLEYKAQTLLEGPYDGIYKRLARIAPQAAVWSSCGSSTIFAINTSLVLNAIAKPQGLGIFSSDYVGIQLQAREC